jgi:hypothetical protein
VILLGVVAEDNGDFDLVSLFSGMPTIKGGSIPDVFVLP